MRGILLALFLLLTCVTGCNRSSNDSDTNSEEFTLGNVQRKIYRGMSQTEVAESLGSPNIVTKNADGGEAWVYDKIGSEITYSTQSGGVWLIVIGAGSSSGQVKTTQKTLTVVIRFNEKGKVETLSYHSSKY